MTDERRRDEANAKFKSYVDPDLYWKQKECTPAAMLKISEHNFIIGVRHCRETEVKPLHEQLRVAVEALEIFSNRRKLAHSLRGESPHVASFVEAIGVEIDKKLKGGTDE